MAVEAKPAPAPHAATKDAESPAYILDAVNNARVALGKNALTRVECDQALGARPKTVQPKVDPENPVPPEIVDTDAQYLVGLPSSYVAPTLDEGRMKTTPPTPPRSE